jgi:mannosyltransferase
MVGVRWNLWIERAAMAAVLLAIAIGAALRVRGLTADGLWLDEAYSAFAADHGLQFIWTMVPRYESHPPVYYSLLSLWQSAFGASLLARRMLGLVCGLGVLAVTGLAAEALGRSVGMPRGRRGWLIAIALLFVALQPLAVTMSREVRPYPVMMMVYAIGMAALMRLVGDAAGRRAPDRLVLAIFFVAQAWMSWLHTLGVIYAAAMALGLAIAALRLDLTRRDWLWLVGGELCVGLVYIPEFLIALQESHSWAGGSWLRFYPASLPREIGTIYFDWNLPARLLGFASAIGGIVLLSRRPGGGRVAGVLLCLAVVPILFSILISALMIPVFLDRTLSPVTVPMLLLAASGLAWPTRWRWLALVPALPMAASMAWIDLHLLRQPVENWYGAVDWLAAHRAPGDAVWAYPNEGELPLDYALRDRGLRVPVVPIPAPAPALGVPGYHPAGTPGSVALYPRDLEALANSPAARRPGTIWVVRHAARLYDPGDRFIRAMERDRVAVAHFTDGPVDIVGLSARRDGPAGAGAAR